MGNPEVDTLCKEFFDWRLLEFPEFATFCGFHQYDDKLNDHSEHSFNKKKVGAEEYLERCQTLKSISGLADSDKENLLLLESDLEEFINGLKYQGYLFQVHYMEGIHLDFEQLTSWMVFKTGDDYQKYLGRLRAIPARLDSEIVNMRIGIKSGKTHSTYSMKGVAEGIDAQLGEPKTTLFYAPFVEASDICESNAVLRAKEEAEIVIKHQIQPALKRLKKCVEEEYIPGCRPKEGISSIPEGEEFYKVALKWHTSTDMTAQEIHDLGLKEVVRIKAQMEKVIKDVKFDGDFKSFVANLRNDTTFQYGDKDSCMEGFKDICYNKIRPTLSKIFKKIPESQLTIEATPASRAAGPMGYYLAGTLDGSRPGKFYANVHNPTNCPKYEMMTLSLHEGEPGHHFQGMYAMESDEMPLFRRYLEDMYYASAPSKFPIHTAYCEGWGLYCEYLGNELGLYEDPYSLFGHLSFEMHRACRLVADTGIHVLGWGYEQAVELFLANTALSEAAIRNEVRRYITWPGQACAYKVGQLKILELRKKATDALGEKFDVREFHEDILKCGMVPLNVLETLVDKFIARMKSVS